MQINKPEALSASNFKCGQTIQFQILARSLQRLDEKNIHFQIQARSNVVLVGSYDSKLAKNIISGEIQSQAKFKLVQMREIVPVSSIFKESKNLFTNMILFYQLKI
jgi:hypothetical protein